MKTFNFTQDLDIINHVMTTTPKPTEALPKPGVVGRSVRFLLGGFLLFLFVNILRQASGFVARRPGWRVPTGDWWLVAIAGLWFLSQMLSDGFNLNWKHWPLLGFLVLAAGAIVWDRLAYGALWAAPLGWLVLVLTLYVFLHAGISFLVAGFVAAPG